MNSHIWKCSQCNNHTKIDLKDDIININCQCGYHSTMNIKAYIQDFKRDKSHNTIKDDAVKDIVTDIKEANVLTYFREIKDGHINRFIDLMSKLKTTYEESYNRYKDMLSFIQILINNYDGSKEMKKNILINDINI